jgi:hypothetical protein
MPFLIIVFHYIQHRKNFKWDIKCNVQLINNNLIRYHKHMYYAGTNLYIAFPANIQTTTHDIEVMIS